MSEKRNHSGSAARAAHKKAWWETWWGVIATTVIAGLIVWGITRHYDRPTPLPPTSANPPSPSVPIVKTPKPTRPSVKIEQHGNGNGAVGGNITTAPCSSVQVFAVLSVAKAKINFVDNDPQDQPRKSAGISRHHLSEMRKDDHAC
jgi:hypothetical protein